MLSNEIFRLLLIILLLGNQKDPDGAFSNINDAIIVSLLLGSFTNSVNAATLNQTDRNDRDGRDGRNDRDNNPNTCTCGSTF